MEADADGAEGEEAVADGAAAQELMAAGPAAVGALIPPSVFMRQRGEGGGSKKMDAMAVGAERGGSGQEGLDEVDEVRRRRPARIGVVADWSGSGSGGGWQQPARMAVAGERRMERLQRASQEAAAVSHRS